MWDDDTSIYIPKENEKGMKLMMMSEERKKGAQATKPSHLFSFL